MIEQPVDRDLRGTPADDRPSFDYQPAQSIADPYLTIVTPVSDPEPQPFAETARSIQRQSFQQWEWLIVDDGSSRQDSREALARWSAADSRVRIIRQEERLSPQAALAAGVAQARSNFILEIACGNLLEPTAAEKWLWFLASHPQFTFVDSSQVVFDENHYREAESSHDDDLPRLGITRSGACPAATGSSATLPEYLCWRRSRAGCEEPPANARARPGKGESRPAPRRSTPSRATVELEMTPFDNRLRKRERRLLFIVPWVTVGGADRFTIDLVAQLASRGWETTLVTTLEGDNAWLPRVARLTPDIFALSRFLEPADYPRFLRYIVNSRQPDVILISNSLFAYTALPYIRGIAGGIPIVDYCHSEVESWIDGGYPRLSVKHQDFLDLQITSSAYLKEWMVNRGGTAEKIEVCHINVDQRNGLAKTRSDLDLPEDIPVIIYAGRITHEKQPRVFAKVVRELRREGHRVLALVVGDGPDLRWLRQFVDKQHLRESVRFLGLQPSERVRDLMAVADCVFLPSKVEGISRVLYEAMAEGSPVVAADIGGQRELVDPECGVLVKSGTENEQVVEYTRVLGELLAHPERRKQMGKAARSRIDQHFTLDRMGRQMEGLMSQATEAAKEQPRAVPWWEDSRKAAVESIRVVELSSASPGISQGSLSWRLRAGLFVALSAIGMPLYRLSLRLGFRWVEPVKDRLFRALFPGVG